MQLARILPTDQNFLLLFRREKVLNSSVEFMRMWRRYDKTRSGAIENRWIRQFLADLILSRGGKIVEEALDTYTDGIVRLSRACARRVQD